MAFSALINRHVFTTRVFDSGALTVLASVIHQFAEPGRYIVSIRRGEAVLGSTRFEVAADAPAQLNIDLAAGGIPGKQSPFARAARGAAAKDCDCGSHGAASPQAVTSAGTPAPAIVAPTGYVQFHVSHGEGRLFATVRKEGTNTVVFDTTSLGAGDLFALSLLAPATFTLENKAGTAKGTVKVSFSKEVAARVKSTAPVYADVTKSAFTPKDLQISSGQGLVFRVKETARIVVTQQADATPQARARGHAAARRIYRVPQVPPRKG
jgi:hypothetical protein